MNTIFAPLSLQKPHGASVFAAALLCLMLALAGGSGVAAQQMAGDTGPYGGAPAQDGAKAPPTGLPNPYAGDGDGGSGSGKIGFPEKWRDATDDEPAAPPDPRGGGGSDAATMPLITATGGLAGFRSSDGAPEMPLPLQLTDQPVVVELFTSQGCSSCPAADAMLADLTELPDVLPLAFHVDYWDYLGWADSFARPEFTLRQEGYARAGGERAVYTPQMIVDGQDTAVSLRPADLMAMIEAHRAMPTPLNVERERRGDGRDVIELYPLSDLGGFVAVTLVRYAPHRAVEVTAGENRGRVIDYYNVVLDVQPLAEWNGVEPLRLTVRSGDAADDSFPQDTRHAILVQQMIGPGRALPGPVLAAMRLD